MKNCVEDGPVAEPAVEKQIRAVAPVSDEKEGVVARGKDEHGDGVAHCHDAGAVSNDADFLIF